VRERDKERERESVCVFVCVCVCLCGCDLTQSWMRRGELDGGERGADTRTHRHTLSFSLFMRHMYMYT